MINIKNLVIVESPSKSQTIEKYLGDDYKVLSSKGHIRDLATTGKYGLGVDLENKFEPNYKIITGKNSMVKELKKEVEKTSNVILATDPDREGEAISWHLKEILDIPDDKYGRVVFNEITENAVKEAFKNPRKLDMLLVKSQEARRILDRIIGFRLSKLMQSKTGGKSAGRVQSVALKIIVDREREILAFVPEQYFTIEAEFNGFIANLEKYKNKKIKIPTSKEADKILSSLSNAYKVSKVEQKEKKKSSKPSFTTSTLTQMASSKLNFSASKTMTIAQKLYEGVKLGSESVGLISYMRTDSTRLSSSFVAEAKKYITSEYGKEYVGSVKSSKKKDNVQDAHEAIRPTSIYRTPESIKKYLKPDEYKLYNLIYIRTISSLMSDAKVLATSVELDNNDYTFKATGQINIFDGYLKLYKDFEESTDKKLPKLEEGKVLVALNTKKSEHFTEAKPRFTEAKLIAELESLGIGRPSTYAKIITTLKDRHYVQIEDKKFVPTEVGITVTDKLQEFFSDIINVNYTALMEENLDNIALGSVVWYELLDKFYKDFEPLLTKAFSDMEKVPPKETGEDCPECGSPLVIRKGKYGEFVACSNYPACKYIKKEEKRVVIVRPCPKCDGDVVEKHTKKGKIFYGCNKYPKCDYAVWDKPTMDNCPKCNEPLLDKNGKVYCPNCDKKDKKH